ncbi:MAG: hypothetical protein EPO51_11750 [Phenylobacterium sp.]|uniref:LPD7 domain-containing protein n=1 Tax=Phenylobacterium sp. TaxID=1871053 RepID=UPI001221184F|nr:LPD7 domain-containing protein [Phenylobacterium sp.]TAJ71790.1 MAG: hypothetical protein EPO51_11750 [Phenylobacterium sp.]
MAEDLNIVTPEGRPRSETPGDVPERIQRRYLTERRGGAGLGFYADARADTATFRDEGHRLSTGRNDPHVIRDLVAIAQHRGWTTISVRGHTEFRREVWLMARAAGLEVRGYRPTERDRQQAERQSDAPRPRASALEGRDRLRIVEAVVRNRVVEPSEQARILAAARARLAQWLDRGAPAGPARERRR